jgi:antitoxin (DNA-binding transcriptional repressor) of toxin-antitoxin stability system
MSTLGSDIGGQELADLSPGALLDLAQRGVVARRAAEVDDLLLVAAWAQVHSTDPRRDPETGGRAWSEDRLVHPGGAGTPGVREFSIPELALAREVSATACERDLADVLDLVHRLPKVWRQTRELSCPIWLSRKIARLSRRLSVDVVHVVDDAVAEAISTQAPGRVLEICEAKVIEADPAAHAARVEAQRRRRYVGLSRADEFGLRHVIARVEAGDAVWIDAMVERVADLIADRHPGAGRDELRSIAMGWLARPAEVLQLLLQGQGDSDELTRATAFPVDLLDALVRAKPERFRPRVDLFVHLSDVALTGLTPPLARVEGVGPLLVDAQIFAGCRVRVTPVIDLNDRVAVDCYEHPTGLARRVRLGFPGDYFPYASATPGLAGASDLDHPTPYDADGPPGQTGTHNSGPLGRRHHRWKTHAGFTSRQCGRNRYVWRTPHGRYYLVDHLGTHRLDSRHGEMLFDAPAGVDLYFADVSYEAVRSAAPPEPWPGPPRSRPPARAPRRR